MGFACEVGVRTSEHRDQHDAADHQRGTEQTLGTDPHLLHAEPPEVVQGDRRQQIGGDEESVEGSRTDLVDQQQAREHGHRAGDPGQRHPPPHTRDVVPRRQRLRAQDEHQREDERHRQ